MAAPSDSGSPCPSLCAISNGHTQRINRLWAQYFNKYVWECWRQCFLTFGTLCLGAAPMTQDTGRHIFSFFLFIHCSCASLHSACHLTVRRDGDDSSGMRCQDWCPPDWRKTEAQTHAREGRQVYHTGRRGPSSICSIWTNVQYAAPRVAHSCERWQHPVTQVRPARHCVLFPMTRRWVCEPGNVSFVTRVRSDSKLRKDNNANAVCTLLRDVKFLARDLVQPRRSMQLAKDIVGGRFLGQFIYLSIGEKCAVLLQDRIVHWFFFISLSRSFGSLLYNSQRHLAVLREAVEVGVRFIRCHACSSPDPFDLRTFERNAECLYAKPYSVTKPFCYIAILPYIYIIYIYTAIWQYIYIYINIYILLYCCIAIYIYIYIYIFIL